ncbi:Trans-1,2-dihydrobenzene-1,2-diol dehydrogenase [Orchesella cincta]|uniref:Trans-1,2-dihydrobenzene-1,2-diol dehydrogenase n=1 Tax=Orchesella cincta TaxID=48709 RepID=A0A1D2MT24_ORCCI|nr:Trans-1,2-dihydrobenzene-1,2-diol dehydrogenase [Orchesella cincta]
MGPLRWGILSAGKISHDFVVGTYALPVEEHQVVAVAARSLESAQKFATTHSIPKAYGSYEELVKDPSVDIVYVGSVNPQHLPLVKLSLNAGKHVLCEKPLGMNVKETKEMLELAQSKKLFLMEAIWSRFFPVYQELKKRVDSGSLGEVLQVVVQFGVLISEIDRLKLKELGGGTVLDIGVYCVQFAEFIFGEKPLQVISGGHLNTNGVDESTSTTLIFSKGRTATLVTHSKVELPNEAVIVGTKKTLKVKAPFWCPQELEEVGGKVESFPLPPEKMKTNFGNSVGLHYQCHSVRNSILKVFIMPLATYQHCIVCYRQQKQSIPPPGSRAISKNSEVCRRFCTLASRHLDLDPYFFRWERTLNTKSIINIETVCDECLEPTTSFCDIYGQLEYLQMQLSWRLVEVCRLMTNADKEDSPHQEYRQTLKNKVESFEGTMKDIEEFRAEFLEAVEYKRKRYNPTVEVKVNGTAAVIPAVQRSDDEDSLFEECTPIKKKKEEVKKEVKEEVKRRGRPKKIDPSASPVALAPTPSPSPPSALVLRASSSKKRPLSPSPPLIPEATGKKRTTITLVEVNEAPNCQPIKKPCPKSKKTNPAPKAEKMMATPKEEKMKLAPKEEKMKPTPKVEKIKPSLKEVKIKPSPKEEKTYFVIDSDSGSDDLFELVKTEKKKPPVPKKPVINLLKKPPINLPGEEDDDEDDDEEEKVAVFSKPGHKISEKDRVPRDLTSFVIGWLNNGK